VLHVILLPFLDTEFVACLASFVLKLDFTYQKLLRMLEKR